MSRECLHSKGKALLLHPWFLHQQKSNVSLRILYTLEHLNPSLTSTLTALPKLSSLRPSEFSPNAPCPFSFYIPQKARTLTIPYSLGSNLHLALYFAFSDSIYYSSHFLKIFHWFLCSSWKPTSKSSILNIFFLNVPSSSWCKKNSGLPSVSFPWAICLSERIWWTPHYDSFPCFQTANR